MQISCSPGFIVQKLILCIMTGIRVKYSAACLSSYTIQHSQEMLHVQNLKVQAIFYLIHQVSILLGQDLCCFCATLHNSLLILWDVWSLYCWIWRSVFQKMTLFSLVDMDQCFRGTSYSARGGSRYLCNNGKLLPDYMVSHAKWPYSSTAKKQLCTCCNTLCLWKQNP
jgi:hypothetical protein